MIVDVSYVTALLESADIEVTIDNIEALAGMLSLEVFPPDQCILDLKRFIEKGGVFI
jgi:hypothetical protein